jgi:hypothetical protein
MRGVATWELEYGDRFQANRRASNSSSAVIFLELVASPSDAPCGRLGNGAESFVVCAKQPVQPGGLQLPEIIVAARTDRGLVAAVGRLLREIRIIGRRVTVPPLNLSVDPAPWAAMRGHQVTDWGFYLPDVIFEQHLKELIVFGCNQIEFAHITYEPVDDNGVRRNDAASLVRLSAIVEKYGLGVSIWNIPWPSAQTEAVFAQMPRVDALFLEGGSVESLRPAAECLRKFHPNATTWHSPSGLDANATRAWVDQLAMPSTKSWLSGVVWGPINLGGEMAMLEALPPGYRVRLYPDLSHTLTAMYPVPDWHFAWAFTEGRQAVNPMPVHHAAIVRTNVNSSFGSRGAVGFGSYSEGAADDFNKALWAAMYLEPNLSPQEVAAQYCTFHFGYV